LSLGARATVRFSRALLSAALVAGAAFSARADVPLRKLALIRQAMTAMKLDLKIEGMIASRVEGRAQKVRIDNPGMPDSLMPAVRATIAEVYAENRAGRDGLDAQVHAVFDRHLTEEDLKFATNFNASDNGKRYREVAPRVVNESIEVGRRWSERLEPEVRRRLEQRFRGESWKF
jgi:hypothetical protein